MTSSIRTEKVLKLSDLDIPTEAEKPSKTGNLFTYVTERFPGVILVFDALDECDDREQWLLPPAQQACRAICARSKACSESFHYKSSTARYCSSISKRSNHLHSGK
jgi:hypothetical protein